MSNLPNWPGASAAYTKAYRTLERMARDGHVTRGPRGYVSPEMRDFIDALNEGDEERVKGLNLKHAEAA